MGRRAVKISAPLLLLLTLKLYVAGHQQYNTQKRAGSHQLLRKSSLPEFTNTDYPFNIQTEFLHLSIMTGTAVALMSLVLILSVGKSLPLELKKHCYYFIILIVDVCHLQLTTELLQ